MTKLAYLIDSKDVVTDCIGITHDVAVKRDYHQTLKRFLANGGVRILCYGEILAVESPKELSAFARSFVNRLLRQNDFYCVAYNNDVKDAIDRPIRHL